MKLNTDCNLKLATPMIGEEVNMKNDAHPFSKWWEGIE